MVGKYLPDCTAPLHRKHRCSNFSIQLLLHAVLLEKNSILVVPSFIHLSKYCCEVETSGVEINTKLSHSLLLSATLSLRSSTNTLFYAGFAMWRVRQTSPRFFIYKIAETYHAYLSKHCFVYPFIRHQQP